MTQRAPLDSDSRIERYLDELRRWGARTNLVGSTDTDALRLHLRESLAATRHFRECARVVDLGSGAGFPGVPLLIARPDLQMTLVESRERRVHFLRHVVRTLELECAVVRRRIEDPPLDPFDYALLRAVAPLARALPLAAPWVAGDGEIWIWTNEDAEAVGAGYAGEISLGERGRILRVRATAVSRETL